MKKKNPQSIPEIKNEEKELLKETNLWWQLQGVPVVVYILQ